MSDPTDADTVRVTFHPQTWEGGLSGDDYAVASREADPITYTVPYDDATDPDGDLLEDDTFASDRLRDHANAPEWVTQWGGPYYVTLEPAGGGDA